LLGQITILVGLISDDRGSKSDLGLTEFADDFGQEVLVLWCEEKLPGNVIIKVVRHFDQR